MVHILLTGASGKLGSHTLKYLLERHHQVTATDIVPLHPAVLESLSSQARKNLIAFLPCDLNDYEAFEAIVKGCRPVVEGLIHLGSIPDPTRHDPRYVHNSNVAGSFNVLQTAASLGIERIVQASSVNAVGLSYTPEGHHRFDALPVREDTPKRPVGQAEISMDYLAQGRKASVCLPWMLTTFRRMHMLYPKREYFLAIDCRMYVSDYAVSVNYRPMRCVVTTIPSPSGSPRSDFTTARSTTRTPSGTTFPVMLSLGRLMTHARRRVFLGSRRTGGEGMRSFMSSQTKIAGKGQPMSQFAQLETRKVQLLR